LKRDDVDCDVQRLMAVKVKRAKRTMISARVWIAEGEEMVKNGII
jgi:hypothetical protein